MSRRSRAAEGGLIYHALNRGNDRKQIFFKPADYLAFLTLLVDGLKRADVEVLTFCLMPNHWHVVLRPRGEEDLSKYFSWVTNTHAKRYREHYHTRGHGHVYQGRFKSFAVQDDFHLLVVLRYVEGNALRARLVQRAQYWPWCGISHSLPAQANGFLSPWPIERPANWLELVNELPPKPELEELRQSVNRQRPYGSKEWVAATAARLAQPAPLSE